MSSLISGLVKKTMRKLGLGGRRRHTKKGGAYLLRPRPMVRPPTPASSEPRRRRKTKKGGAYLLRPRPMVRPPTPASSEPRRRRKTKSKKN